MGKTRAWTDGESGVFGDGFGDALNVAFSSVSWVTFGSQVVENMGSYEFVRRALFL